MPLLTYSLLRLVVLLASFGLFWLLGMRGWLWLIVSALVAAAVSYLVLPRQRDAAVGALASRAQRPDPVVRGADEDAEDAVLDGAGPDGSSLEVEPREEPGDASRRD